MLGQHEQALAVTAQPQVATTVEHQGTDLSGGLIDALSTGLNTLQAAAHQPVEAAASRTYIYHTILIDSHTGEDDILAGRSTHVEAGINKTPVAIGQQTVHAQHQHLAIQFEEHRGRTQGGLEFLHLTALNQVNRVIEAALPQAPATILIDPTEIAIGALDGHMLQLGIGRSQAVEPIAGSAHKQGAVGTLADAGHTRRDPLGE